LIEFSVNSQRTFATNSPPSSEKASSRPDVERRAALNAQFDRRRGQEKELEAHQPRLKLTDSVGKLATRLFVLASVAGQQAAVERDVNAILQELEKLEVRNVFENPIVKKDERKETIRRLGSQLGLSTATLQFLDELAESGKLRDFRAIVKKYEILVTDARHEIPVTVIAPTEERARIIGNSEKFQAVISQYLKPGEKISLKVKADLSLLDGYQVEVAGYAADFSLKSQLAQERKKLERARPEPLSLKLARIKEVKGMVDEDTAQKFVPLLKSLPYARYMDIDAVYPVPAVKQ